MGKNNFDRFRKICVDVVPSNSQAVINDFVIKACSD